MNNVHQYSLAGKRPVNRGIVSKFWLKILGQIGHLTFLRLESKPNRPYKTSLTSICPIMRTIFWRLGDFDAFILQDIVNQYGSDLMCYGLSPFPLEERLYKLGCVSFLMDTSNNIMYSIGIIMPY